MKKCPYCAEDIQDAAIVCKHCGRDVAAAASKVQIIETKKKTSAVTWLATAFFVLAGLGWCATVLSPLPDPPGSSAARTSAPDAPPPTPGTPAPTSKWGRSASVSKVDDSKGVTFALQAESDIQGWLKTYRPTMIIRCQEGKTDAYIVVGMNASVEYGLHDEHTVTIRIDDAKAVTERWNESTSGEALFSKRPVPLARSLAKSKRLLFQFTPFNGNPQTVEFDVTGFDEHLPELAKTCGWKSTT